MSARSNLRAVPATPVELDLGPDIYAKIAEKRAAIDWAAVHIAADRRAPLNIPFFRGRSMRLGSGTIAERGQRYEP
jgi:hypothetical protein